MRKLLIGILIFIFILLGIVSISMLYGNWTSTSRIHDHEGYALTMVQVNWKNNICDPNPYARNKLFEAHQIYRFPVIKTVTNKNDSCAGRSNCVKAKDTLLYGIPPVPIVQEVNVALFQVPEFSSNLIPKDISYAPVPANNLIFIEIVPTGDEEMFLLENKSWLTWTPSIFRHAYKYMFSPLMTKTELGIFALPILKDSETYLETYYCLAVDRERRRILRQENGREKRFLSFLIDFIFVMSTLCLLPLIATFVCRIELALLVRLAPIKIVIYLNENEYEERPDTAITQAINNGQLAQRQEEELRDLYEDVVDLANEYNSQKRRIRILVRNLIAVLIQKTRTIGRRELETCHRCLICMEKFEIGTPVPALSHGCLTKNHFMHILCLRRWLTKTGLTNGVLRCPICSGNITN